MVLLKKGKSNTLSSPSLELEAGRGGQKKRAASVGGGGVGEDLIFGGFVGLVGGFLVGVD